VSEVTLCGSDSLTPLLPLCSRSAEHGRAEHRPYTVSAENLLFVSITKCITSRNSELRLADFGGSTQAEVNIRHRPGILVRHSSSSLPHHTLLNQSRHRVLVAINHTTPNTTADMIMCTPGASLEAKVRELVIVCFILVIMR
jgi:hypothetical protein